MRRSRAFLVILALGVAVLVALTVGGTSASAHNASQTYLCAYGKRFGSLGRVYWAMSVSPKVLGPAFCRSFNSGFRGRRYYAGANLGTGFEYCKYSYSKSGYSIVGAVFADKRSSGRAFCTVWHPAGWKRF